MGFVFFALLFILILVFLVIFLKNHKKSQKNDDIIVNLDLSDILIFDTETTGVNPKYEEILELAIINGCGDILFNGRFRPEKRKTWKHAQEINGISPDDVKDCKPITEYLLQLQEIFDKPKIIAGYNVNFDLKFIHAAGIKTHADYIIDVMEQFADERGIYDEEHGHNKWFKLEEAANYYGYQFKPHGALEDCKATLFVLKKIQGID
jgi:DNA polymerase III subunit epsilon